MVNGKSKLRNTPKLFAQIAKNRQVNADKFPNKRPYYRVGFRAQCRATLLKQAKKQMRKKFLRPTQAVTPNNFNYEAHINHIAYKQMFQERALAAKTLKCFQNALRVLHRAASQNDTLTQFMSMAKYLMPDKIYKTITDENPDWWAAALLASENPDQEDVGYYSNDKNLELFTKNLQEIFFDVNMQNSTQSLPGFKDWLDQEADRNVLGVAPSPFNLEYFGIKH